MRERERKWDARERERWMRGQGIEWERERELESREREK